MFLVILLSFGGFVGFAIGWGTLSQKRGCILLLAVPVSIILLIFLQPVITGDRPRSTAGLDVAFGSVYAMLAAILGALLGVAINKIVNRDG